MRILLELLQAQSVFLEGVHALAVGAETETQREYPLDRDEASDEVPTPFGRLDPSLSWTRDEQLANALVTQSVYTCELMISS